MILNKKGLEVKQIWEEKGYRLPKFDYDLVAEKTRKNPFWLHFGPGNIFRAFQTNIVQRMLDEGTLDRGLVVAEGYDYEIVEKINRPMDNMNLLVTLKSDGTMEKTVIASIMEALILDTKRKEDYYRLKEIFEKKSLQMVTFTITEKGYSLIDEKGKIKSQIERDFKHGAEQPESYLGKVVALLYHRYLSGKLPIAMVSMDNCSHNGDKLYEAVVTIAEKWVENKLVEPGFWEYLKDSNTVSFPWTMIDKITPRPDPAVEEILKRDGIENLTSCITSKNTYVAPFVNAEECEYLIVEDNFPNKRPPLEEAGVLFTTREIVDKVEKMKVGTCLNPLHTALAVFGCLLGYERIAQEMQDNTLRRMVEIIGYEEGLLVVTDPGILSPKEFLDKVVRERIPNPFMPDTPQRIATDTSQKLSVRFGETIKAYHESAELKVEQLRMIPLVFAGWLRYLMARDDEGNVFELSPDPLLPFLKSKMEKITFGADEKIIEDAVKPILENETIFGVNLYQVGMAKKVIDYLTQMTRGTGDVRRVLEKIIG